MKLDIDEIIKKSFQNDLTKDFIQKLSEFLEDFKFQNNIKEKKLEEIQLNSLAKIKQDIINERNLENLKD